MVVFRVAALLLFPLSASCTPATPTVRLQNGVEMPMLAMGTWQYNDTEAEEGVSAALRVGFTMVDTAYDYHNQVAVGRAVRAVNRSTVFVETKVPGCGMDDAISSSRCYSDTKKVLEEDLQRLGMTYVDLVIIHFPPKWPFYLRTCSFSCQAVKDQWKALEEFYAAGKARAIGVSNYCPSCFRCLDSFAKVYPMVNQVSYHIGMGTDPSGIVSFCKKRGVAVQAYSPLGNTPWRQGANPSIMTGNCTTTLAKNHGKGTIPVALKWLVQHGIPTITKSSNPKHLAEDLDLWSWNLTDAEMADADRLKIAGMYSFACNFEEESSNLVV